MKTTLTILSLGLGLLAGCNNEPFGMAVNLHAEPVKAAQGSKVTETSRIDTSLPVASDVFKSEVGSEMSHKGADNQSCLSVGACE